MKIPELYEHKKPVFSLEIFPPKKKGNIESIYDTVEQLALYQRYLRSWWKSGRQLYM